MASFNREVTLKDPLMTEARLLARDARQTLTVFQAGLPRSPKLDSSSAQPANTQRRR